MPEVRRKLISHTAYLLIAWISSIVFNFIFQLLAAKTLAPEEFGMLVTAVNFAALVAALLPFGMDQASQRLAAFYLGKNKMDYLRTVLWFFFTFSIILNIILIIGLLVFSSEISQFLKLPKNVFLFSVAVIFPLSMSIFLNGVLRGYQRMRQLSLTAIAGDFIKLVVAVILVLTGYKIFGFLAGFAVANVCVLILRLNSIKFFISRFKIPDIRLVSSYTIPSFTTQMFWLLILNGQYLIISTLQDTYATGLFAVGMILSNQIYFIPKIISDALFPITSQMSGTRGFLKQQRNLLNLALRYSLLVSLPILFFVVAFPKPLIFLIGKPDFFPAASTIPILVSASLVFGISTILSRTLFAMGKPLLFQSISLICTVFYLAASITLTYFFSTIGTAVAYLSVALLLGVISLHYLRKYLAFKPDYTSIFKLLAASASAFSLLYLVSFFVPNLIIGGILTFLFTLVYFTVLYFAGFYNENDLKILDFMSEKTPFGSRYIIGLKSILLKRVKYNHGNGD